MFTLPIALLSRGSVFTSRSPGRVFFTSPAPGTLADAFGNDFYQSDEVFVNTIGAAMAKEYQATLGTSG